MAIYSFSAKDNREHRYSFCNKLAIKALAAGRLCRHVRPLQSGPDATSQWHAPGPASRSSGSDPFASFALEVTEATGMHSRAKPRSGGWRRGSRGAIKLRAKISLRGGAMDSSMAATSLGGERLELQSLVPLMSECAPEIDLKKERNARRHGPGGERAYGRRASALREEHLQFQLSDSD